MSSKKDNMTVLLGVAVIVVTLGACLMKAGLLDNLGRIFLH